MNPQQKHPLFLLSIVLALFLTNHYWANTKLEYLFAVAGIFITGIPHGAMDHHTAAFINGTRFKLQRYLLQYLISAVVYLAGWFMYPGLAFLLFLMLTAWHFGETDSVCFGHKKIPAVIVFVYGWSLLMWLLLKDASTILYWTDLITGHHRISQQLIKGLTALPHQIWFVILAAIVLYMTERKKWLSALLFLIFIFCAVYTSLLLGFVVYFAGWHSLQALHHLRTSVFQRTGIKQIIRNALPAVAGALVILFIIFRFGAGGWIENNGLPSLFVLLSVLTLPHMVQMHRLYQVHLK